MMDTDTMFTCIYLLEFDSLIVSYFGHLQISLSLGWAFLFLPIMISAFCIFHSRYRFSIA
ncbi:hypothetical protein NHN17_06235 [Photobacterium sp. ZSDE20]|uniref:Uncharacterized protein n=1 Tax=Photobacterium pectinilyticum TaxID=2906793 RepID=A0ABT1MYV4_9GAMM|nr:hypothetical protein [Photobacterium sp. ZSDE20]MCQ1057658.1 hypothetical protein [Photobacterium sp. ZSDE20]